MGWDKHSTTSDAPPPLATVTATPPPATGTCATGKQLQNGDAGAQESVTASVTAPIAAARFAWVGPYLECLALSGSKMEAARAAGVNPSTVMRHRNREPGFIKAEEDALRQAIAVVESEIRRRAMKGVMRVRYGRDGKVLSREIEYSDTLILRLAERLERGTWSQRQIMEHEGAVTFKTKAERQAALEKARAVRDNRPQAPVTATNGRS
jgi:hypothetical protein